MPVPSHFHEAHESDAAPAAGGSRSGVLEASEGAPAQVIPLRPATGIRTVDRDYLWLFLLSAAAAVIALVFYYRQNAILLYGDAVAHINIARRVFDSRTPGLFQLGTVWLPLPHLLDLPFIRNDWLWHTGVGASIPSILAYVAGTLGVFRLVRALASRATAWIAALTYALNPNLLYMQATAMTESLYLALFVWTVVFFCDFVRQAKDQPQQARRALERCAIALAGAMLVRYDAWFLAVLISVAVLVTVWWSRTFNSLLRHSLENFFLLILLTPGLWLAYNHAAYGNALEFANGPYSAQAIQQRNRTAMPSYPGENSPRTAALYFLKSSRLNLGREGLAALLFTTAFTALLAAIYFSRRHLPWILLWTPAVFYTLSIAWAKVPIYVPGWWPFSYYNIRYGLQMLPAVAVFLALAYEFLGKLVPPRLVAPALVLVIGASYFSGWRAPICLRDAAAMGKPRQEFERRLAAELRKLPESATLLMDCTAHPGALQEAEIPFRRVLRESNPPYWEIGLAHPARSADYVIAIRGDDVARAVRLFPAGLDLVATVGAPGDDRAFVYRSIH